MKILRLRIAVIFGCYLAFLGLVLSGCTYRYRVGSLQPLREKQGPGMRVLDDGTVLYVYERLEIGLRPIPDEELNRRFPGQSHRGKESTNPFTYGNWVPRGEQLTPQRFTVFRLSVKNYTYPKMLVNPYKMTITSQNNRIYSPLNVAQLKEYYLPYVTGYAGNPYAKYKERTDILERTLYPPKEFIFSGQERSGYVVFPPLDEDVRQITVRIEDIALRFDSWGRPVETLDLEYHFQRDVDRIRYPLLVTRKPGVR